MPCEDPRSNPISFEKNQEDIAEAVASQTKLLCYACRLLADNKISIGFELNYWWQMHQRDDKVRVASELKKKQFDQTVKERQQYFNSIRDRLRLQLTDEEREAVGLKS